MKAKVKVASIILALVAITLIGYFAGCGEQRLLTSVGPTEKEEVKNQAAKDMKTVLRRRVPGDKQITNILRTKDESGTPLKEEITYPRNWREIVTDGLVLRPDPKAEKGPILRRDNLEGFVQMENHLMQPACYLLI